MNPTAYTVKILSVETLTHNVKRFHLEKPEGYTFIPGQATELTINKKGWLDKRNPFTFTSLNEWPFLEFTIKIYDSHHGVTQQLGLLQPGDELILHDVWGAIQYKGEGYFIAGGAGITPFIAILRQLYTDKKTGNNKLFFSNRTASDIIMKEELSAILGTNFVNTITGEKTEGYDHRHIDETFLKDMVSDFQRHFYICGPDPMVQSVQEALKNLGAASTVITVEI